MHALLMAGVLSVAGSGSPVVEEGRLATPDGVRLFWQKVGNGPQKVILPAGLFLRPDLDVLAAGRTLVFYDMRNRGRSDRVEDEARLTIEADVADLEAVRRHFGFERVSAVGYSYLGLMVALYAMEHPGRVDRLVQIGPVPLRWDTEFPPELTNPDAREVLDPAQVAEVEEWRKQGWDRTRPREFCEKQWALVRRLLVGDPAKAALIPSRCHLENEWPVNFDRHLKAHFQGSVQKLDVPRKDVAAKVTHPVLVVHGTRDRNAPYGAGRDWAGLLPDARLITVAGAAHQAWVDEPRVLLWIDEFLGGRWPEAAERVPGR